MSGLIELLFVFAVAIGWAVFELRGVRQKADTAAAPPDPAQPPDKSH